MDREPRPRPDELKGQAVPADSLLAGIDVDNEAFELLAKIETHDLLATFAGRVRELEEIINEAPDMEQAQELAQMALEDLNEAWPHTGRMVQTIGQVLAFHEEPGESLFDDDEEVGRRELTLGFVSTAQLQDEYGGNQGESMGFTCVTIPTYVGGEQIGERMSVFHVTQPPEVVREQNYAQKTIYTLGIYSQPDMATIVPLDEPPIDELEFERPEFMADIDQALYNSADLEHCLKRLGELVISGDDVEADKEIDYCRYINHVLHFDSLPYAMSGYGLVFQLPDSIGEEEPIRLTHPPSPNFFAQVDGITAVPLLTETEAGELALKTEYQFGLQVKIFGKDNRTMRCVLQLSEPLDVVNLREVHY